MSLTLALTFIATFLLVCLIAYALLSPTNSHRMNRFSRREGARTSEENPFGRPVVRATLFTRGIVPLVAGAIVLGLVALSLQLFEWLAAPLIGYGVQLLWPVLVHPDGPLALAAIVLVVGVPLGSRFRRRARFRGGVIAIVAALATFWPLQYAVARLEFQFWEWNAVLHGLAFFVSVCLLAGGLQAMSQANDTV